LAKGPTYKVVFRRRRVGRTNYHRRRSLVLSHIPRFVPRGSLRNMSIQIVEAKPEGDSVLVSAHSNELKELGWLGSGGNLPAAYLTGLLAGVRANSKGIEKAILDLGLFTLSKGTRILSSVKGALDAGLNIPHSEEILPSEERLTGKHIANYGATLSQSNPDLYKKLFSRNLDNNLSPEQITDNFESVKQQILKNQLVGTDVPV
jgi:large subunit ribosomal protein L18